MDILQYLSHNTTVYFDICIFLFIKFMHNLFNSFCYTYQFNDALLTLKPLYEGWSLRLKSWLQSTLPLFIIWYVNLCTLFVIKYSFHNTTFNSCINFFIHFVIHNYQFNDTLLTLKPQYEGRSLRLMSCHGTLPLFIFLNVYLCTLFYNKVLKSYL